MSTVGFEKLQHVSVKIEGHTKQTAKTINLEEEESNFKSCDIILFKYPVFNNNKK